MQVSRLQSLHALQLILQGHDENQSHVCKRLVLLQSLAQKAKIWGLIHIDAVTSTQSEPKMHIQ